MSATSVRMNNPELPNIRFIVQNILEFLRSQPDNHFDLVITSPPYNKNIKARGWLVRDIDYSHHSDMMDETDYQQWQINVLNELYRVTKPGGSLFYNHKVRWFNGEMIHPFSWISQSVWKIRQEIIWDKAIAANLRGWRFWQIDERIYWLYKPIDNKFVGRELDSKHAKMASIWRLQPAERSAKHPAPFPVELPARIIHALEGHYDEPMAILDPFVGTGTTAVAAKILGHHCIGVDISPDYIEMANERLKFYKAEIPRVEREKAKHIVKDPFKKRKERGTVSWPFGPPRDKINGTPASPLLTASGDNFEEGPQ